MRPIAPRSVPSGEDGAGQPHEFSSQRVPAAPAPADRGSGSRQVRDRHVDDVGVNDDGQREALASVEPGNGRVHRLAPGHEQRQLGEGV